MREQYFDEWIRANLQHLDASEAASDWEQFAQAWTQATDAEWRAKLVEVAPPTDAPSDWDAFEAKLAQALRHSPAESRAEAEGAPLPHPDLHPEATFPETAFQEALHNYEASYEAADWDAFRADMYGSFDASVEAALQNYAVPYEAADWELMHERLNQPLYTAFHEKMWGHQVPFRAIDWWRLSGRMYLMASKQLPARRWAAYAAAAAVALLLLFSVPRLERTPAPLAMEAPASEALPSLEPLTAAPSNASSTDLAAALPTPESEPFEPQQASGLPAPLTTSSPQVEVALQHIEPNAPPSLPLADAQLPSHIKLPTVPDERAPSAAANEPRVAAGFRQMSPSLSPIRVTGDRFGILKGVPELGDKSVAHLHAQDNWHIKPEVRLGAWGGYNSSMAELTNNGETGYQGGMRVELVFSEEWSVVSGLGYTQKQFQHQYRIFSGSESYQRLLEARLKAVEIPALARYTFPSSDKLSLYMQFGLITMITTDEQYLIFDPNSIANAGVPEPSNLRKLAPQNQARSFHTYVGNLQTALGFQYSLNDHINLNLEPYFQLGLQPMGSEEKRLYVSGVNLAIMYRLGVKEDGTSR